MRKISQTQTKRLVGGSYSIFALFSILALSSPEVESASQSRPEANPNIFADLAEESMASVVNISSQSQPKPSGNSPAELFRRDFERFFGFEKPRNFQGNRPPHARNSLGTGVIIDTHQDSGLILTNHHVVSEADHIQIQLSEADYENPSLEGEVVGSDPELDIALIEVKSEEKLEALSFGDSDDLRVGEFVLAIGNPFGQGHSVSHGIISAKGRSAPMILGRYLQTDTPINPGNSGGPLLNLEGDIVGINNAILAQAQGIGYAIPSNEILKVLPQLKETGEVERGFIGLELSEVPHEAAQFAAPEVKPGAPYVVSVSPESPAEAAGFQAKDVILELNEKAIHDPKELIIGISGTPIGEKAEIKVLRSGTPQTVKVEVSQRPS